jgi:hypothetical protein
VTIRGLKKSYTSDEMGGRMRKDLRMLAINTTVSTLNVRKKMETVNTLKLKTDNGNGNQTETGETD